MTNKYDDLKAYRGKLVYFGSRLALEDNPERGFLMSDYRPRPPLVQGAEVIVVAKDDDAFYVHDVAAGKGHFVGGKDDSLRGGNVVVSMSAILLIGIVVWGLTAFEALSGTPVPVVNPVFAFFTLLGCLGALFLVFISDLSTRQDEFKREFDIPLK